MKRILFIIIITALFQASFGQKGTVKGEIYDFITDKPLEDAVVILLGTTHGVKTNNNGEFGISKLKLEETDLIISGGPFFDTETNSLIAKDYNYINLLLRDIPLSKENKLIDLGKIYLVPKFNEEKCDELQPIIFNNKLYRYVFETNVEGIVCDSLELIDFNEPIEN